MFEVPPLDPKPRALRRLGAERPEPKKLFELVILCCMDAAPRHGFAGVSPLVLQGGGNVDFAIISPDRHASDTLQEAVAALRDVDNPVGKRWGMRMELMLLGNLEIPQPSVRPG